MSGRSASGGSLPGGLRSAGGGFTLPQTPPAGEDFTIPSSAADGFEDFVSGSSFEVESGAGFGTSALEFIPSGATAGQQRLAVEGRPEFTDPLPLGGGYLAALLGGRFVVVDVRRARERILYEDYLKMLGNGSSVSQQLLISRAAGVVGRRICAARGERRGIRVAGIRASTLRGRGRSR